MDSVVQPSNNRGQVFCSSLRGLEILTTVRPEQNLNNTNEPAEFLVRNIATVHTMTRVCTKDLLIVENYAPAVILSNQSKRNELNVFSFTWLPFYLKPYKDFV